MLRKLIIAGAALAALATPALAANWYVLRDQAPPDTACFVADHAAAQGERQIAGPFANESRANAEVKNLAACDLTNHG